MKDKFNKAEIYLKNQKFGSINHDLYHRLCVDDRIDEWWDNIKTICHKRISDM